MYIRKVFPILELLESLESITTLLRLLQQLESVASGVGTQKCGTRAQMSLKAYRN